MGGKNKPAGTGGGGWLAAVRKVFKPAAGNKDQRHAKKQRGGGEVGGGDAAEVVSVEHFPPAADETSPEVTNEGLGAVVWLERREGYGEVAGACRRERDHHRGMASANTGQVASSTSRRAVARTAAARRRMGAWEEERAAVRIQAFYRGYLARRALRALRGLVRLQALVRGHQVRRQVHRTMRCMQALVRAQGLARARRLTSSPYVVAQRSHPRHQLQHGGARRSFGHELHVDHHEIMQARSPPRRSNVSPFLKETWDPVRADGMLLRHDTAAAHAEIVQADTYAAYDEFQHRRQTDDKLQGREKCNAGWNWMTVGAEQRPRHAPAERPNHHGAAETSFVAADGVPPENTDDVDIEAASTKQQQQSPTSDLYPPVRHPPAVPGYMAATHSARAKARTRPSSGSAAPGSGGSSGSAPTSHNGGARAPQQRAAAPTPSLESSGDRTPPPSGGRRL